MQIMKDRSNHQIERLRFAFYLMEDKKIEYEAAEKLLDKEFPCEKDDERSDLDLIPLYKTVISSNRLTNNNEKKFRHECLRLLVSNSALSNAYWQALKNLISYSLSIIVCSLCVFFIIGLKVLPGFTNVYLNSEYAAPEVTRWVVSWSQYYWLAIIAVALVTLSTIFLAQYFNRQLMKMAPLNQVVRSIIPSGVTYYYHEYLVVQFAVILVKSGTDTKIALEKMKAYVFGEAILKQGMSGSLSSLDLAQRLGVLEKELEYQAEQTSEHLMAVLYSFKNLMNRAVFVFAAIFVGISLVAVYLPIFHFGQVF